jgi:hypothetical protein
MLQMGELWLPSARLVFGIATAAAAAAWVWLAHLQAPAQPPQLPPEMLLLLDLAGWLLLVRAR